MKIGFLIIGSEVLDGKISDLNTKTLAEFLRPYHLEMNEAIVVRDHPVDIQEALKKLFSTKDLIVTSGGLGPTKDDITKESLGTFFQKKIIFNEESKRIAEENYNRMKKPFPGESHGYCFLPEGFIPLSNSTGFAPGFYYKTENCIVFSAPGVPREFKSMLQDHLEKLVSDKLHKNTFFKHLVFRTKNVPEEKIFGEVDPSLWDQLATFGEVSSLPIIMGVDIGVKIKANNFEDLEKKSKSVLDIINNSPIRKHVWNFGTESIEEKIIGIANKKRIKFGFAESATGGLCSHRMTSIPGSSQSFMGSIICYDENVKENLLGVSKETLKNFTAVSRKTAEEMASGLQKLLNLDLAISITGYAGPTGGTEEFPVGSVCIGRSLNKKIYSETFVFNGDRELLKQRFSQAALYALLEELENFAEN